MVLLARDRDWRGRCSMSVPVMIVLLSKFNFVRFVNLRSVVPLMSLFSVRLISVNFVRVAIISGGTRSDGWRCREVKLVRRWSSGRNAPTMFRDVILGIAAFSYIGRISIRHLGMINLAFGN